jgi:hypothetical protein
MEHLMMHHLGYIELVGYASLGLGAFKLLSNFVIKMIAIFGREEFSNRAFRVLRMNLMEHRSSILRSRTAQKPPAQSGDLAELDEIVRRRVPRRDSDLQ